MAKAKKLKSGNWRALVFDYRDAGGKRHYASFTAESKKEAEFLAAEFSMIFSFAQSQEHTKRSRPALRRAGSICTGNPVKYNPAAKDKPQSVRAF